MMKIDEEFRSPRVCLTSPLSSNAKSVRGESLDLGGSHGIQTGSKIAWPLRCLYWSGATSCFSLAMIGVILPGLPTTPFLLLMSYCLLRVSPELHARVLCWPVVGEPLRVWHEQRGVPTRVKCLAIGMVVTLVGVTLVLSELTGFVKLSIASLALLGIFVVLKLPAPRTCPSPERVQAVR